jgi:hypothetical protein
MAAPMSLMTRPAIVQRVLVYLMGEGRPQNSIFLAMISF